jgi:predicted transcriptional regulator
MNPNGNARHLTAKIVSEYVSHHKLAPTELSALITTVHQALGYLGQPVEAEVTRAPVVSIRQSVRQNYVVCLDCGFRGLMLRRHLRVRHELTPNEYRQRWALKNNHPLTAPGYAEQRSAMAKALGLGRKPAKPVVAAEASSAATAATSEPARRARGATKRVDKPATTRRSRRAASKTDQPTSLAGER